MGRTKLIYRRLPDYSRGEEIFNMVSHIVGGVMGIAVLVLCVVFSAIDKNVWGIVSSSIYGATMILLYTMSSIYHGLTHPMAKKVFQVLDHCTIYFLIAGTYTPITLCALRPISPGIAWTLFGLEWGMAALAVTLTAIDIKQYQVFSMTCYLCMGWGLLIALPQVISALGWGGLSLLMSGGILYVIGAILYGIGKKKKYIHCVFHLFCVFGSMLQFFAILFYVI